MNIVDRETVETLFAVTTITTFITLLLIVFVTYVVYSYFSAIFEYKVLKLIVSLFIASYVILCVTSFFSGFVLGNQGPKYYNYLIEKNLHVYEKLNGEQISQLRNMTGSLLIKEFEKITNATKDSFYIILQDVVLNHIQKSSK